MQIPRYLCEEGLQLSLVALEHVGEREGCKRQQRSVPARLTQALDAAVGNDRLDGSIRRVPHERLQLTHTILPTTAAAVADATAKRPLCTRLLLLLL